MSDNNSITLRGKIHKIYETQTFNSGFQKREFVIETEEEYSQKIKMTLTKDKCDLLDKFSQSDLLFFHINLRGNEYKERFYVDLICWRISKNEDEKPKIVSEVKNEEKPLTELPF